jgi:hypothetical protein
LMPHPHATGLPAAFAAAEPGATSSTTLSAPSAKSLRGNLGLIDDLTRLPGLIIIAPPVTDV